MKSFIRWSATLGLIGTTLLASFAGPAQKALALPQEEVVKALQPVPVFTIVDSNGAPLIAVVGEGEEEAKVTGVFISQEDAQQFLQQLRENKPDVAQSVQVQPVSLGEVYKLAQQNAGQPEGLNFAYVPIEDEVQEAREIQGEEYQGGVPLFVARGGEDGGYLTIEQNNQSRIPFFFEKEQLEAMVTRFKSEQPDLASTVSIEVVPLERMIALLQQSDDEALTRIILVPTEESMNFIRSSLQNSSNQ